MNINSEITEYFGKDERVVHSDELLLSAVAHYPCLYNSKNKQYRNMARREDAWREVAASCGKSVKESKKRFRNIKDLYKKKKKKIAAEERLGAGPPEADAWRLMGLCSFLDQTITIGVEAHDPRPSPCYERKRRNTSTIDDDIFQYAFTNCEAGREDMDENAYFGLCVGKTLSRMSRVKSARLKTQICSLLAEAEDLD